MQTYLAYFTKGLAIMEPYDNKRPLILPPYSPVLLRTNNDGSVTIENVLKGHDGLTLSDNFEFTKRGLEVRDKGIIITLDSDPIELEGTEMQREAEINKYFHNYNDRAYMEKSASEEYVLISNMPYDFFRKKHVEMFSSIFNTPSNKDKKEEEKVPHLMLGSANVIIR